MPTKRKVERRRRPNRKTVKKRAMRTRRRKSLQKKRRRKTKKGGKWGLLGKKTEKSEKEKILDDLPNPPNWNFGRSYGTKKKDAELYVDNHFEKMKELYDLVKKEVEDKEFTANNIQYIQNIQNIDQKLSTIGDIQTASLELVHQKRVELLSVFKMIYELHKDKKSLENQETNYEVTEIKEKQFALYNKETKKYYHLDDIYSDLAEQLISKPLTGHVNKGLQAYYFAIKMSPKKRGIDAVYLKKDKYYEKFQTVFTQQMNYDYDNNNIQIISESPQDEFKFETIDKANKVYDLIYKVSKAVDILDETNMTEKFMAKFHVKKNGNNNGNNNYYYLYNEHISEYIPSYTIFDEDYVKNISTSLKEQYNYTKEDMIEHTTKLKYLLIWRRAELISSYKFDTI